MRLRINVSCRQLEVLARTIDAPNIRARIKVPLQTVRKSRQNEVMHSRTKPQMDIPSPAIPPHYNAARRIWVVRYNCLDSPMHLILDLDWMYYDE